MDRSSLLRKRAQLLLWVRHHPSATVGILAILIIIVARTWREAHQPDPRLEWGWVTNCTGPVFSKFSQDGATAPGPERPVFKINDQLVLAVPRKYRPSALSLDHAPAECRNVSDLPPAHFLYFVISGDWSAGYKQADVPALYGQNPKDVRPDQVWVRIDPARPSKPGASSEAAQANSREFYPTREIAGLTCKIPQRGLDGWFRCSGSRSVTDPDVTTLEYSPFTKSSFVFIRANYTSPRYGGISVYYRTLTSDISHWRDIDTEVWNLIAQWSVLRKTDN